MHFDHTRYVDGKLHDIANLTPNFITVRINDVHDDVQLASMTYL